jgi:hypothetical protein
MTPSALDTLAAHVPGGARRPLPPDNSRSPAAFAGAPVRRGAGA